MDAVLRASIVYFIVFLLFRISGRRTLSETTPFDFVIILIIGEATQQALLGEDYSITNAALIITTLLGIDVFLSLIKRSMPAASKIFDNVPTVLVADGQMLEDKMHKARVEKEDILEQARQRHGLARMDQIRYAVLEVSGGISIIPKE